MMHTERAGEGGEGWHKALVVGSVSLWGNVCPARPRCALGALGDFAMVMSPQAASGLDGVSASHHKNEAQTQYSLHHPCLMGVPMVGRNQYGYITPAFLGSPWWGEINLVRSGCGGNEQKMDENW